MPLLKTKTREYRQDKGLKQEELAEMVEEILE